MVFKRFLFILLACLLPLQAGADTPSLWFSKDYQAPTHFFSPLQYQPTSIGFEGINHAIKTGRWFTQEFQPVAAPGLSGGHYFFIKPVSIEQNSDWVVDLTVSSYVANFWFTLYRDNGELVASFSGGVNSHQTNPYFLRHGRPVSLPPGNYLLAAEFVSPFFIAAPLPNLIPKNEYQQSIKLTNVIALLGIGIFFGLGLYYLVMSVIRRNELDLLYAGFIWSNLVFNCATLLVFSDIFHIQWFFFGSATIAISNILYVMFVMRLLKVKRGEDKFLFYAGCGVITVMLGLLLHAFFINTGESNANNRLGVLLFAAFGFFAALSKSFRSPNRITARLYLLANVGFLGPALIATITPGAWSMDTTYASHWGIMAVAIEVILLSFLIAYQLNRVHKERDVALIKAQQALDIARTDRLTGVPNRYSLDEQLESASDRVGFTFIDLDGLKRYNDSHGHSMGDELLKSFAILMQQELPNGYHFFRVAGDEFAIVAEDMELSVVEEHITKAVATMQNIGFENMGASFGTAYLEETEDQTFSDMMKLADIRMYQNKVDKKTACMAV